MTPYIYTSGFDTYKKDFLRDKMKEIYIKNPNKDRKTLVSLWREEIDTSSLLNGDEEGHIIDAVNRTGHNLLNSVISDLSRDEAKTKVSYELEKEEQVKKQRRNKERLEAIHPIWDLVLPGMKEPIHKWTGSDVRHYRSTVRPIEAKFWATVEQQVAPGERIDQTTFTKESLQKLWLDCQK